MLIALPQPLKTLYALLFACFAAGFVSAVVSQRSSWWLYMVGSAGVFAIAAGAVLVTDFKANATKYAGLLKTSRPWGVDYSRSFMSSPVFVRLLGAGVAGVGLLWIVLVVVDT